MSTTERLLAGFVGLMIVVNIGLLTLNGRKAVETTRILFEIVQSQGERIRQLEQRR